MEISLNNSIPPIIIYNFNNNLYNPEFEEICKINRNVRCVEIKDKGRKFLCDNSIYAVKKAISELLNINIEYIKILILTERDNDIPYFTRELMGQGCWMSQYDIDKLDGKCLHPKIIINKTECENEMPLYEIYSIINNNYTSKKLIIEIENKI
jgi:hypothetical protein